MCFFKENLLSFTTGSVEILKGKFPLKPCPALSRGCFGTSSKAIFRKFYGCTLFLINPIKICAMTVFFFFLLILKSFKYNSYK